MTTKNLSPHQQDLLLDVLEAARNIRDFRAIKDDMEQGVVPSSDKERERYTKLYDGACEAIGDLLSEAAVYLPHDLLVQVSNEYLPEDQQIDFEMLG